MLVGSASAVSYVINIGAALPITVTPVTEPTAADRKTISALKAKFRAVAEARGRPVELAEAMVDPEIEIEGLAAKGEPLTLTAAKAVELGVADFQAASLRDASSCSPRASGSPGSSAC